MFFITNRENYIIAADADFLSKVGALDIYEASKLLKNDKLVFDGNDNTVACDGNKFTFSKVAISAFFGDSFMYTLQEAETIEEITEESSVLVADRRENITPELDIDKADTVKNRDDEIFNLATTQIQSPLEQVENIIQKHTIGKMIDDAHSEEKVIKQNVDDQIILEEEEIVSLVDDSSAEILEIDTKETPSRNELSMEVDEDHLFEILPTAKEIIPEENINDESNKIEIEGDKYEPLDILEIAPIVSKESDVGEIENQSVEDEILPVLDESEVITLISDTNNDKKENSDCIPVLVDIEEVASLIGISKDEYINFSEDFHTELRSVEIDLRSQDRDKSIETAQILKETSSLLHMSHITELLDSLSTATNENREKLVDKILCMIGSKEDSTVEVQATVDISEQVESNMKEEIVPLEITLQDELEPELEQKKINISSNVEAIPLVFSIQEASDELMLPVSLVNEFVVDYINQAYDNLPLLREAYSHKNIEQVQQIAHLLKGASSNLRITALAQTLQQLQTSEDINGVLELINRFEGQLMSLSIQMGYNKDSK